MMKVAIVGPAHPYKGGIAQHTTELAHRLADAGHDVTLISWRNQYPFFYPGKQFVPDSKPELPVFPNTKRVLSWKNLFGWVSWAWRLRDYDRVIFVWWVPTIQGPVYASMLQALGKKGPKTTLLCHNVLQHSAGPADRRLARTVFAKVDQIVVHSEAQAQLAATLTKTPVTMLTLAAHLPSQPAKRPTHRVLHHRLLFFGLVRRYKGVDVLIKALAEVPGVQLTIAGEMWGTLLDQMARLIQEYHLEERVTLRPGYVPAEAIPSLFAAADALVLPYRSGTATQNAELAFAHGIPVIATRVGNIPDRLHDGADSILCAPDNAAALAAAIKQFYEPGVAANLQKHIPQPSDASEWQTYISQITAST